MQDTCSDLQKWYDEISAQHADIPMEFSFFHEQIVKHRRNTTSDIRTLFLQITYLNEETEPYLITSQFDRKGSPKNPNTPSPYNPEKLSDTSTISHAFTDLLTTHVCAAHAVVADPSNSKIDSAISWITSAIFWILNDFNLIYIVCDGDTSNSSQHIKIKAIYLTNFILPEQRN